MQKYFTPKSTVKLIFYGVLLIHFIDLVLFCFKFLIVYSDSDQTILWLASSDMSNGWFYEPAFYGQAYNTMVEALLAVPFIKLNFFIPYALAVSSVIFSYSVIWIFSRYYFKRQNYLLAILCLALPIILPTEFQIMITISRGFIPGISFTLFGVYMLLTYKGRLKLIMAGFLIAMGFVLNPNSSVILSAFSVYYLLKPNPNIWHEIKYLVLGGLPAVAYKVYVVWFYYSHPNYNLHIFPNAFEFSLSNWVHTATEIYYLFMGLIPIVNNVGCLSILLLLIFVLFILKMSNKRHEQLAAILGLCFIIFSFGINKVSDGSGSPFFPYSRMFLGIPILYIFYLSILQKYSTSKISLNLLGVSILMVFSFKAYTLPNRINYIVNHNTGVVKVFKIKALCKTCDSLAMVLKNTNSEVLVLKTKRDEINYGCPALTKEINTIHPSYERRLWVYKKYMFLESNQFFVYSDSMMNDPNAVSLGNNYYLIKNEKATTLEAWYKKNNFKLRPYKK